MRRSKQVKFQTTILGRWRTMIGGVPASPHRGPDRGETGHARSSASATKRPHAEPVFGIERATDGLGTSFHRPWVTRYTRQVACRQTHFASIRCQEGATARQCCGRHSNRRLSKRDRKTSREELLDHIGHLRANTASNPQSDFKLLPRRRLDYVSCFGLAAAWSGSLTDLAAAHGPRYACPALARQRILRKLATGILRGFFVLLAPTSARPRHPTPTTRAAKA